MYRIFDVFVLLCVCSFVSVNSQHDHKVNVAVYYESLCADSIKFVTNQLYPALQKPALSKHVNLTLVPYGKSVTKKENNDISFNCSHGPAECKGNKIHACALNFHSAGGNGVGGVALDFINCLLDKVEKKGDNTELPVNDCAAIAKVPNAAEIGNCANDVQGTQLLEKEGEKTALVEKPLASVPTIVFDKHFDRKESRQAEENFVKTLCSHITQDKPADCNSAGIQTTPMGIALVMLIVVSKLF